MPGSHLFNLGLFQKRFNSTSRVTGPAINIGCTKGRGSSTRILNWCKNYSPNPSLCVSQFITFTEGSSNPTTIPGQSIINSLTPTTIPGQPIIISITNDIYSIITVTYSAPINNGGKPITSYQYTLDGVTYLPILHMLQNPFTISGLTNGESYDFQMRAVNSNGVGPSTPIESVTIHSNDSNDSHNDSHILVNL
jgi:hypothetical protein